jgi:hypothetical protein
MTALAWVLGGWVAASAIFALGCWWGGRHTRALADPDHAGCQATIGRLSAELAKETRERIRHQAAADYFARVVAAQRRHIDWQEGRIDQLEHEQAIDGGTTLAAEAERFLAEGGGS